MSEPPERSSARQSPTSEDLQALTTAIASDVEVRKRELDVQAEYNEQYASWAHRSLDVQAQDLEQQRGHDWRKTKLKYAYVAFGGLVLVAFLVYTIHTENQDIAFEVLKLAFVALAGGGVGYTYGRSKAGTQESSGES